MVKIGIVGLGDMGLGHLRGFEKFQNCEIVALCDSDEKNLERSKNFLRKSVPKFFNNYSDILSMKDLNAVVIAIPNYLHSDFTCAALDRGLDVFLEKPVANTIEGCDKIIEKVGESDRIVQIGLVYRYSNLYRKIAQMIEDNLFGDIMMMYCKEYRDNFPTAWFFDEKKSGGAILDKNCHHFDIFNWYINSQPLRVVAFGGQHVVKGENYKINCSYAPDKNLILHNPTIVDHAFVLVEYENGAKANLGLCMYEVEPIEGLEIGGMGTNGSHFIAKRDASLVVGGGPLGEMREIEVDYFGDNEGIGHIGCQIERKEFLECVEKRNEPYANLYIGRQSIVVSLAAERSIKEDRVVYIREYDNPRVVEIFRKRGYLGKKSTPPPATYPVPVQENKEEIKKISFTKQLLLVFKLLFRKKVKGEFRDFEPSLFENVARVLNSDEKYLSLTKGLNAKIEFKHQDKPSIFLELQNGKISLPSKMEPEISIVFTQETWRELFSEPNIQKLFLTRKIPVHGNISKVIPYAEAFLYLTDKMKQS